MLPVTVGGSTRGSCLCICLLLLCCLNQLALGLIDVLEQPICRVPYPLLHLQPKSLLSEVRAIALLRCKGKEARSYITKGRVLCCSSKFLPNMEMKKYDYRKSRTLTIIHSCHETIAVVLAIQNHACRTCIGYKTADSSCPRYTAAMADLVSTSATGSNCILPILCHRLPWHRLQQGTPYLCAE